MPIKLVEGEPINIENPNVEELTELGLTGLRKYHHSPTFWRMEEHFTGPEGEFVKSIKRQFQEQITGYWILRGWARSRERDIVPINLVTSIEELGKQLAEIKECLEELNQRKTETPDKWTTQIRDLDDENYKLVEPILVLIEEYPDDTVIARFPEIEVFGAGSTDSEAILNLKNSILDLYDELVETDPNTLGKLPLMWLRILKKIVAKV